MHQHVPRPLQDPAWRGSVLPLVALLVVAAGGLALTLGRFGATAATHARARTAADAAALAGAAEGRRAAELAARANGATLVAYAEGGHEAEVTVAVQGVEATARAARTLGGAGRPLVPPALAAAVARAEQVLGEPIARSGLSPRGVAVPPGQAERLAPLAATTGLCPGPAEDDAVHFVVCRGSDR